jgi:hypothetical protein
MTTDIIEGTAVEVEPERALVVQQPGQALVASADRPAGMIAVATALADALKNIVDRQHLYTEIRGKRYPQVEAWMTIGRLDNVVAREVLDGITRHDDGSYEAYVELIRLSDGMVIGRASALCGMADDEPWGGTPAKNGKAAQPPRAEYARRAMAVTRATSRAFRQQYSWIMALAGYQPTPADEMPDERGETHQPSETPAAARSGFVGTDAHPAPDLSKTPPDGLIGKAVAEGVYDFEIRQTPEGWRLPFRVKDGSKSFITVAEDALAEALIAVKPAVLGERVTVWGHWSDETIPAKGTKPEIRYRILHLERIATSEFTLPAPVEAPSEPLFPEFDMAALDAELAG